MQDTWSFVNWNWTSGLKYLFLASDGLNFGFNYEKNNFFLLFLKVAGGMEAEEKVRKRLKKRVWLKHGDMGKGKENERILKRYSLLHHLSEFGFFWGTVVDIACWVGNGARQSRAAVSSFLIGFFKKLFALGECQNGDDPLKLYFLLSITHRENTIWKQIF